MQRAGLEWAWRLAQDPRRLARRYLVDSPAIIALLRREARERRSAA
jgi:UDP-N-acetyl-D-mannosaminuronic acid transferase (WecB/TagA/CpsF family)